LGVALVFAAGNFPFAFSVAGGDTASALAAGCPVVLKVHDGHPELSASVGGIVKEVFGDGFGLIHGTDAGRAAAVDRRVRAAAFTGSTAGGRALFDLAAGREDPIPFYGELGSVNPVFVTPAAVRARGDEIAEGYVASFTLGSGQLCTKPGLLFLPAGHGLDARIAARAAAVAGARMLEDRIAEGHAAKRAARRGVEGMRVLVGPDADDPAMPRPTVLLTSMAALSDGPSLLREECFGPTSIVVEYDGVDELVAAADLVEGSLTATVHAEPGDAAVVEGLVAELRDRAGRIVWNGWPTGVRVGWAMQHGGPWPASTSASHTSVGAAAIDRFTRPLAFQNAPQAHLPPALRDLNELGMPRRVDGVVTTADVGAR
jgi:NADP-dependent aldehyde dehydrogenase